MRFNIIMDDGGVYTNCLVLVSRGTGMAESKRDIHIDMKYQGGFCICNKYYRNHWIDARMIYEIEPIEKKPTIPPVENEENEEYEEDDFEELEIPETKIN